MLSHPTESEADTSGSRDPSGASVQAEVLLSNPALARAYEAYREALLSVDQADFRAWLALALEIQKQALMSALSSTEIAEALR
jgi:hypothetical protein